MSLSKSKKIFAFGMWATIAMRMVLGSLNLNSSSPINKLTIITKLNIDLWNLSLSNLHCGLVSITTLSLNRVDRELTQWNHLEIEITKVRDSRTGKYKFVRILYVTVYLLLIFHYFNKVILTTFLLATSFDQHLGDNDRAAQRKYRLVPSMMKLGR